MPDELYACGYPEPAHASAKGRIHGAISGDDELCSGYLGQDDWPRVQQHVHTLGELESADEHHAGVGGERDRVVLEERRVVGEFDVHVHRSAIARLTSLSSHRLAHNMEPVGAAKRPATKAIGQWRDQVAGTASVQPGGRPPISVYFYLDWRTPRPRHEAHGEDGS